MTDKQPSDGSIILPATIDEVPAFLSRTDFTDDQAQRLQVLVNYVTAAERKRLTPMSGGSKIEVFFRGDWVPGVVNTVHKGGLMEIDTEQGPTSKYAKSPHVRWPEITN